MRESRGVARSAHEINRLARQSRRDQEKDPLNRPGGRITGGDANTVMRGVIDLVYRSPEGWKIVDYKSDPVSSRKGISAVVDRYRNQVMAYAHHWQEMAGEPAASAGLWLSEGGGYEPL